MGGYNFVAHGDSNFPFPIGFVVGTIRLITKIYSRFLGATIQIPQRDERISEGKKKAIM